MEGRDRAVIANPDVSSVGVMTEGFRGEGDRRRNVRQERGEFAVQVVIFYMNDMFRFFLFGEKKDSMSQQDRWMERLTRLSIFD